MKLHVNRPVPVIGHECRPQLFFVFAVDVMLTKLLHGLNNREKERRLNLIGQVR
jgi:hypothetical protein